jgi:hypothetical protein
MLDLKIIDNVDGKTTFSLNDLYRFYFNSKDNAENLFRTWKSEVHEAGEVVQSLVQKVQDLYEKAIVPDEDGGDGHTIVVENALQSTEYKSYINAACELQMVNLNSLSNS